MSEERPEKEEGQELSLLREEIGLTSSKLLDLTYNQPLFADTLANYNSRARALIDQNLLEEALLYLSEAEKLLEYGAGCGKPIDRALILCTLHNQACCFYKASDLPSASRYLEAVIFNLKTHIDSVGYSPAHSTTSEGRCRKSQEPNPLALQKNIELAHYYLKYCTINSQAKNRIVALDAGKRTIQALKAVLTQLGDNPLADKSAEAEQLKSVIKSIRFFREEVQVGQLENYVRLGRYCVRRWHEERLAKKISYGLEKHVSNYSISEVIQMTPIEYQSEGSQGAPGSKTLVRQILNFSMGYFTISTQYRLIAQQLYGKQEDRLRSQEFTKANIYHLLSVIFLALNLRCDLLFMKQILSSYDHHFKACLLPDPLLPSPSCEQLAEQILFQPPPAPEKALNCSLAGKLQKLKSRSKERKKVHTQYEDTELYESKAHYKLNGTKHKGRSTRSGSKLKLLSKGGKDKKSQKILNQSLFQSSRHLNPSKENKPRSISQRERPISKGARLDSHQKQAASHHHKQPDPHPDPFHKQLPDKKQRSVSKGPPTTKALIKVINRREKKPTHKKGNDEYQLSHAKCPNIKKKSQSNSSAELSCSIGGRGKRSSSKRGKGESSKEVFSKHYYV